MLPEQGGPGVANELYNVERIARSEVLTRLLADYSQLPPELSPDAPRLGEPLPGGAHRSCERSSRPMGRTRKGLFSKPGTPDELPG